MEKLPIKRELNAEQILFAKWLSVPGQQKGTQKDLAIELGVSDQTLCNWKKDPRIIEIKREYIDAMGDDLVPDAIEALKKQLTSKNEMVANKAAKDILDRWGQTRQLGRITSIKEFYVYLENKGKVIDITAEDVE